ncbi:MAG: acyl-CoA thioesterase II [Myxococcales bacterium]|nr:acyl-CoA thioesterase II [Myxococcales bacterium]
MADKLGALIELLSLERIEDNVFRGESQDLGWGAVFGGQVLGQALSAAGQTVAPGRLAHSLHAYFLRRGDVTQPILYQVERLRDGGSFSARRVAAIQHGEHILHMTASFQEHEAGFEHQDPFPDGPVPAPESLPTEAARLAKFGHVLPRPLVERLSALGAFDLRTDDPEESPIAPTPRLPRRQIWMKANGVVSANPALQRCLLAYVSDFTFMTTSLMPHGKAVLSPGLQAASIDHAMWFHRPFAIDEWLLHTVESPTAQGARGLARGRIFSRDGRLVTTTAQEGLIRMR